MKLTVVGSGDASNALGRNHSCYLLEADGARPLMIDFGPTALAALRTLGREPNELGGVAFTHLHGDHAAGYPFLVIDAMFMSRRQEPLAILGPPGTPTRCGQLLQVCYRGISERHPPTFELGWQELPPGRATTICGFRVEAFAAEHMSLPDQALCLRVTSPAGVSVAFSGDTMLCEGLFQASQGCQLTVCECSGLAPPMGKHVTWSELGQAWDRFASPRLLLTHLGAAVREAIPRLSGELPSQPQVDFADDGQVFQLG